ncbi:DUF1871 family protein [Neobacillus sp. LXY-1]|uniref:DUF1871 family protein n=1 Tax=Neobacillus sp. LXY-1 TaxID=3379133 RepID=UPI003EE2AA21
MRKEIQTHLKYAELLTEWDPFPQFNSGYETEIVDVIQAVHELDHSSKLAKRIQEIYDFSFEKILPLENCLKIAEQLMVIKNEESCSI